MLILASIFLGLIGLAGFVFAIRQGQFEDVEAPKYAMLREDEEDRL